MSSLGLTLDPTTEPHRRRKTENMAIFFSEAIMVNFEMIVLLRSNIEGMG